jgi:hypothetical protein
MRSTVHPLKPSSDVGIALGPGAEAAAAALDPALGFGIGVPLELGAEPDALLGRGFGLALLGI